MVFSKREKKKTLICVHKLHKQNQKMDSLKKKKSQAQKEILKKV